MDEFPHDGDFDPDEFVPSASDPVLPMNYSHYHQRHRNDHHELLVDFSGLQLSPPSLPSLIPSSIPSSSSCRPLPKLRPQQRNIPSSSPFSVDCPSCGHRFLVGTDIYSMSQPRWDSEFLVPLRSPLANQVRGTGCNFLKDLLSEGSSEDIALVFSVVSSNTTAVMFDLDGSSLFQKLLEVCSHQQRSALFAATIADVNSLLAICCNDHGATAMRKLVDYCHARDQIRSLMHALRPYLFHLAMHDHGHRIVELCLRYFFLQYEKGIFDPLLDNWEDLAKHKFGCCILQKALDLAPKEDRDPVLAKIANDALGLAQDSSGNYLVQHVLEKRIPYVTFRILRQFEGNFASLSIQKYSSNVVEKCLKCIEKAESTKIIYELLRHPNVLGILEDRYGNYVIQTALSVAKPAVYKDILDVVKKHSESLSTNIHGRNVIKCLNKKHIYR